MEDGNCLLTGFGDEFLQDGSDPISSITQEGHNESNAFSWADDLISSATSNPEHAFATHLQSSSASVGNTQPVYHVAQNPTDLAASGTQQQTMVVIQGMENSQGPSDSSCIEQLHQVPTIISTLPNEDQRVPSQLVPPEQVTVPNENEIHHRVQQNHPIHGVTFQKYVPSSLVSQTLTSSKSPAPVVSPLLQQNVSSTASPAVTLPLNSSLPVIGLQNQTINPSNFSAPNVNVIQMPSNMGASVPVQGIMQGTNNPARVIQGQTAILSGHGQNIVHTQNTVIQSPNVVNLNVAHVLCNNQQNGVQPGVQNVQGSSSHPVNLQGISGTIIQTPQGKFLIPAQQSINLANIPNLQQVAVQPNVQTQPNLAPQTTSLPQQQNVNLTQNPSMSGVVRIAQNNVEKVSGSSGVGMVNFGSQPSQVLIQRANTPGQNIILRPLQPGLIQLQPGLSGQSPAYQNIPGSVINHSTQGVQLNPLSSGSNSQPIQMVSQQPDGAVAKQIGSASPHGTVTLNIGGQSVQLQQGVQSGQLAAPISGLQINQQGQLVIQTPPTYVTSSTTTVVTTESAFQNQAVSTTNCQSDVRVSRSVQQISKSHGTEKQNFISSSHPPPQSHSIADIIKQSSSQSVIVTSSSSLYTSNSSSFTTTVSQSNDYQTKQFKISNSAEVQVSSTSHCASSEQRPISSSSALVHAPSEQAGFSNSASQHVTTVSDSHNLNNSSAHCEEADKVSLPPVHLSPQDKKTLWYIQRQINNLISQSQQTPEQTRQLQQLGLLQKQILSQGHQRYLASTQQQSPTSHDVIKPTVSEDKANMRQQNYSGSSQKHTPINHPNIQLSVPEPVKSPSPSLNCTVSGQDISSDNCSTEPSEVTHQVDTLPQPFPDSNPQHTNSRASFQKNICENNANVSHQTIKPPERTFEKHSTPDDPYSSEQNVNINAKQELNILRTTGTDTSSVSENEHSYMNSTTNASQNECSIENMVDETSESEPVSSGRLIAPAPVTMAAVEQTNSSVPVLTQVRFGSHLLTLNLTQQRKQRLEQQLAKMTVEQQDAFLASQKGSLQRILQQQQQLKHQIEMQNSSPNLHSAQPVDTETASQDSEYQKSWVSSMDERKRLKRPAVPPSKATLIHYQLSKDQQHALKPDTRSVFKNNREACRRLLRYHVFQGAALSKEDVAKEEHEFQQRAENIIKRKDAMLYKFQSLMMEEDLREHPSSEMVMIQRMMNNDLQSFNKREKKTAEADPDSFEPLPAKYLKLNKDDKLSNTEMKAQTTFSDGVNSELNDTFASDMSEDSRDQNVSDDQIVDTPREIKIEPEPSARDSSTGSVKLFIRADKGKFISSLTEVKSIKNESDSEKEVVIKTEPNSPVIKSEPLSSPGECEEEIIVDGGSQFNVISDDYKKDSQHEQTCSSVHSDSFDEEASMVKSSGTVDKSYENIADQYSDISMPGDDEETNSQSFLPLSCQYTNSTSMDSAHFYQGTKFYQHNDSLETANRQICKEPTSPVSIGQQYNSFHLKDDQYANQLYCFTDSKAGGAVFNEYDTDRGNDDVNVATNNLHTACKSSSQETYSDNYNEEENYSEEEEILEDQSNNCILPVGSVNRKCYDDSQVLSPTASESNTETKAEMQNAVDSILRIEPHHGNDSLYVSNCIMDSSDEEDGNRNKHSSGESEVIGGEVDAAVQSILF